MKNFKLILTVIAVTLLHVIETKAQFTASSTSDIALSSGSTGVEHTGNDIVEFGGNDLLVTVWDSDNSTPGIAVELFNVKPKCTGLG